MNDPVESDPRSPVWKLACRNGHEQTIESYDAPQPFSCPICKLPRAVTRVK